MMSLTSMSVDGLGHGILAKRGRSGPGRAWPRTKVPRRPRDDEAALLERIEGLTQRVARETVLGGEVALGRQTESVAHSPDSIRAVMSLAILRMERRASFSTIEPILNQSAAPTRAIAELRGEGRI